MFRYIARKTREAVELGKQYGIRFTAYSDSQLNDAEFRELQRIAKDEFGLRTTGRGVTRGFLTGKVVGLSRRERNKTYAGTTAAALTIALAIYSAWPTDSVEQEPGTVAEKANSAGLRDSDTEYNVKSETQSQIQAPAEKSAGQPPQPAQPQDVKLGSHGEFMRSLFQRHYDRSWEATKEVVRGMKEFGEAVLDYVDGYVRKKAEAIRPRIEDMVEARRQKANAVLERELISEQAAEENSANNPSTKQSSKIDEKGGE